MPRFAAVKRRTAIVATVPSPAGGARFMDAADGTGSVVTNPVVGDMLYVDPGNFTGPLVIGYTSQIQAGGVDIPDEYTSFTDPLEATFEVTEEFIGQALRHVSYGVGVSGASVVPNISTATAAVIDLSVTAPLTIARTSASAATPFTTQISGSFNAAVKVGYGVQKVISTDRNLNNDGNFPIEAIVYDEGIAIASAAELADPTLLAWPAFDDSAYPRLYEMQRVYVVTPTGGFRYSPWSNMAKKDDSPVNSTAYSKYRLSVTQTPSSFYTQLGEFRIMATEGGANTINNAGVTISANNAVGGAAANARDGSASSYWATDFGGGVAFPHVLTADYSGGTPIAANQFQLQCATGGGGNGFPKSFTIDGWNGSAWVTLISKTQIGADDGEVKTYVL